MQNSYHYLKVFIVYTGPFNSLILRIDAWLIEGLNNFFWNIYVLSLVGPNFESQKRMCVVDLDFVLNSQQTIECIAEEVEIQDPKWLVIVMFDDYD